MAFCWLLSFPVPASITLMIQGDAGFFHYLRRLSQRGLSAVADGFLEMQGSHGLVMTVLALVAVGLGLMFRIFS